MYKIIEVNGKGIYKSQLKNVSKIVNNFLKIIIIPMSKRL